MADDNAYHEYLMTRSNFALYYRNFYLYPQINRNLKGKVLDVGCGIGDFLKYRKNNPTIGIDINKSIVAYCKSQGLNVISFEDGKIGFDDDSFDGVVLDNVLEHIEDPSMLLYEIRRVLKNDGTFIIGVPGVKGYQSDPDHKCFYDDQKLSSIERFGFKEKKSFYTPLFKSKLLSERIRQYCIYKVFKCVK